MRTRVASSDVAEREALAWIMKLSCQFHLALVIACMSPNSTAYFVAANCVEDKMLNRQIELMRVRRCVMQTSRVAMTSWWQYIVTTVDRRSQLICAPHISVDICVWNPLHGSDSVARILETTDRESRRVSLNEPMRCHAQLAIAKSGILIHVSLHRSPPLSWGPLT
jgi:hypothetical protein